MQPVDISIRTFSLLKSSQDVLERLEILEKEKVHLFHCNSHILKEHHKVIWQLYNKYMKCVFAILNPPYDLIAIMTQPGIDFSKVTEIQEKIDDISDDVEELEKEFSNFMKTIEGIELKRDGKPRRTSAFMSIKQKLLNKMMFEVHKNIPGLEE